MALCVMKDKDISQFFSVIRGREELDYVERP